jgi:hypothetical protein
MRRFIFLSFSILAMFAAAAQVSKEKSPSAFKLGGMITVAGGQSGTRNWAPAGEEKFSLTVAANLILWANKEWNKNKWTNTLDVAYALINTTSGGVRKIDDKLDLYSKYTHSLKGTFGIGMVANLRTQFVNGYDYSEGVRRRISGFFAPAYIAFSPGVQYTSKNQSLNFHFGPAARWVIVTNAPYSLNYQGGVMPDGTVERTLAEKYGVDPRREVRFEVGPYFSALFNKEIVKNAIWKTRMDISSDIIEEEPFNFDVYWTNVIGMKVNNWLTVNYNFDLYYDDDVKMFGRDKTNPATQMKSILGVGVAVKF